MNLLDTDKIIELLSSKRYEEGAISTITLIEVLRGINENKTGEVKKLLEQSFHYICLDNRVILTYCSLYNKLKDEGKLIPDADLLIAATAIANGLSLKTGDKHLNRLEELGLSLESEKRAFDDSANAAL